MNIKELQQSTEEAMDNHYETAVQCLNCGFEPSHASGPWYSFPDMITIPNGITVKEFTKNIDCPECGCKGFK